MPLDRAGRISKRRRRAELLAGEPAKAIPGLTGRKRGNSPDLRNRETQLETDLSMTRSKQTIMSGCPSDPPIGSDTSDMETRSSPVAYNFFTREEEIPRCERNGWFIGGL